ncbi:MAG: S1 RNA-binding domain-containing protein [Anaerolineae bacterium]|nr:S1 RNA-binding domain-containing protein [Anaerolineae bacterium]
MLNKSEMSPDDFAGYVAQNYPRWSRVVGRVTKVQRFGVFVEFDDGLQGLIRRREMAWDSEGDLENLAAPGQRIEVVVINFDQASQRLELSRRLVEHDPWQEFISSAQPGQTVQGQVVRVMPYGAFVELIPGVVGLVRVAEIAPWFVEQVEDVLWVGDHVQAEILSLDPHKRHVALSIKKHLKRLEREATQAAIAAYVGRETGGQLTLGERLGLTAEQLAQPAQPLRRRDERILIVEDEQALADMMEKWLRKLGYRVDVVYSGDTGLERALATAYYLIFMDLNLPGLDGLEVTRQILAHRPASQIALMTGADLADEHGPAIESIDFVEVLLKPFTPQEVEALLERLEAGEQSRGAYVISQSQELAEEIGFFRRVAQVVEQGRGLVETLTHSLAELRSETKACAGAIFALDPVSHAVSLVAHTGVPLAFETYHHRLSESPVKDVILEQRVIWEKEAGGRGAARFRYLLPLLNFESCLGAPIKTNNGVQHGLFLFHPQPNFFSPSQLQHTLAMALVLGAAIERSQTEEMMRSFQQLFLVGQLSGGLAHEVNNKLASVEFHSNDLLQGFTRLEQEQPDLTKNFIYRELRRAAETIVAMNRSVMETARMFRTLIAGDESRPLQVNDVIKHTQRLMEPLARKHQVELQATLSPDLPRMLGVRVRLQQAFHNVILNAIQQIAAHRQEGGRVELRTEYRPEDSAYPLKIFIFDDGPGIHRQHFEQVFKLGFTTRRHEGTGLGLYITRGLIESMGGRIQVAESYILMGATFLIELPAFTEEATHD